MVDAVAGQVALASLTGLSTADQHGKRKNPLLPTPLRPPENTGRQRAPAILYFDVPRVSADVFSTLQDAALLRTTRRIAVGDERVRLEAELRQRIEVIESLGSPGRPATPDTVTSTTTSEYRLDANALSDLQKLIDRFTRPGGGDYSNHPLVRALADDLHYFSQQLGDPQAGKILGQIIGRVANSVIGRDGLQLSDLFKDPQLFLSIARGLEEFGAATNNQAARALGDIILRIGNPSLRFYDEGDHQGHGGNHDRQTDPYGHSRDGNGHDGSGHAYAYGHGHQDHRHGYGEGHDGHGRRGAIDAVGAAIRRLGRALEGEDNAVSALSGFLEHLGGHRGDRYSGRIADVLQGALGDLQNSSLDQQAIDRLQSTIQQIQELENVSGRHDDRLRAQAAAGLQDILDRHVTVTSRTVTTVTPGEPAVPPTPPSKTVNIIEETKLVPTVAEAQRYVTIYQSAQEGLKPLYKLSQPPPPVPNLQVLVPPPDTGQDGEKRPGQLTRQEDDKLGARRFGLPYLGGQGVQSGIFNARLAEQATGQFADSRA